MRVQRGFSGVCLLYCDFRRLRHDWSCRGGQLEDPDRPGCRSRSTASALDEFRAIIRGLHRGRQFQNGTGVTRILTERWNGLRWAVLPSPIPSGATSSTFTSVSCTSSAACIAVGGYESSAGSFTLAERFNGATWSIQRTPNPSGSTQSVLNSVACTSPSECTAVGSSGPTARGAVQRHPVGCPDHPRWTRRVLRQAAERRLRISRLLRGRWIHHHERRGLSPGRALERHRLEGSKRLEPLGGTSSLSRARCRRAAPRWWRQRRTGENTWPRTSSADLVGRSEPNPARQASSAACHAPR